MLKFLYTIIAALISTCSLAENIIVSNERELIAANSKARPGDIVVLKNGEWKNVTLSLDCKGTKDKPITFRAETPGKVLITGYSRLMLGGENIIVDGLYFTKGYAGNDAVIKFRTSKNEVASNCRVTNTVINGFNNDKRMNENTWVYLYGKNNRIDHSSFLNKLNMGVLMAVILDDDRSRENFHSIDHNYFGFRLPLASNTGETIRVGVSEHCTFNSNTLITDNYFENCDGETEIISIKSGRNIIRNNVFKECQGSVVLRHGDNNTVENNIFLGNNKEGSGGVRVINKGQWVINNLFYKTRGVWFRSPLAIMNGVPNSPAHRYVAVTDALIANNIFYETSPIGLAIGSDTERTVPPREVTFSNNVFYNSKDTSIYTSYDDISGIRFLNNKVSHQIDQQLPPGFHKAQLSKKASSPLATENLSEQDKNYILKESKLRLEAPMLPEAASYGIARFNATQKNTIENSGAHWFSNDPVKKAKVSRVTCKDAAAVLAQLTNEKESLIIRLTGTDYNFNETLLINKNITFTGKPGQLIRFRSSRPYLLHVNAGGRLQLKNLQLDLSNIQSFITTDTSGKSKHLNIEMHHVQFKKLNGTFLNASKAALADSIIIDHCSFTDYTGDVFEFDNETSMKGLYNVEKFKITNSVFQDGKGTILDMVRGGNDESTMGPFLLFSENRVMNCSSIEPLIELNGTQRSVIKNNTFVKSNKSGALIRFLDVVKADHLLHNNVLEDSGVIEKNVFVRDDK